MTATTVTNQATHFPISAEGVAHLLRGLADINRLRIINLLLHREELCVCDIDRVLDMTQTKVSRHLTILRNAGLVLARRQGRWMHYSLLPDSEFKRLLFATLRDRGCDVTECLRDLETLADRDSFACDTAEGCA
jgi:ArsR family transcriptional regulator